MTDPYRGLGVSERFRAATRGIATPAAGPIELLPGRLAAAAAAELGADAAGLSLLSDEFRIPLGASDGAATVAERLQFTARQGPCWAAINADSALAADQHDLQRRWPQFAEGLFSRTAFRSAVSLPLRVSRHASGAVDLYFRDPVGAGGFDLGDATAVCAHVAAILDTAAHVDTAPADPLQGPGWARGPGAQGRLAVWIAVGMLMGSDGHHAADAVEVLRAAAYSDDRTVDEVAADLLEGRLAPEHLLGGGTT